MRRILIVVLVIGGAVFAIGQHTSHTPDHAVFTLSDIKWANGPASLPSGAKVAALEGDPAQEGPFTIRLQFPDGYSVQPHWHPGVEHVTVISGTLNLGTGEKFDKSQARPLPAGSFSLMQAGMRHFAWAKGETVIQVHGVGPWKLIYVNAADDPRNKKQ